MEKEGLFDAVQNKDGELLLCIKARLGKPDHPRLTRSDTLTAENAF